MDRAVPGQSQQKARPCAGAEGNVPSGLSGSLLLSRRFWLMRSRPECGPSPGW